MSDEQSTEEGTGRSRLLLSRARDWAVPGLVVLVAAGLGAAGISSGLANRDRPDAEATSSRSAANPACAVTDRTAWVPASGALFGINADLDAKPLSRYAADLGHKPAVAVTYVDFPYGAEERDRLNDTAAKVRADGHILLLTLEPKQGLEAVTPEAAAALARDVAAINAGGVPVIIRFGHEMNGFWFPWAQQPLAYTAAFTRVADAVHAGAPGTAMMWAPSYAGGYAYPGRQYEAQAGTPEFGALDTNGDGRLNTADDPYAPYYPGDAAVDWVGLSLFHWGSVYPWGENEVPEANKFAAQLTGTYNGANGDESFLPDFYAEYATDRNKPFAIPGTAALYNPAAGGAAEADIKRAWWEQVFSPQTRDRFPQLKMLNWFDWDTEETEVNGRIDWTVTSTPAIRDDFAAALTAWLVYGGNGCGASGS